MSIPWGKTVKTGEWSGEWLRKKEVKSGVKNKNYKIFVIALLYVTIYRENPREALRQNYGGYN